MTAQLARFARQAATSDPHAKRLGFWLESKTTTETTSSHCLHKSLGLHASACARTFNPHASFVPPVSAAPQLPYSIIFSLVPNVEVVSLWLFALKVGITAVGINLIGAAIYWRGSRLSLAYPRCPSAYPLSLLIPGNTQSRVIASESEHSRRIRPRPKYISRQSKMPFGAPTRPIIRVHQRD